MHKYRFLLVKHLSIKYIFVLKMLSASVCCIYELWHEISNNVVCATRKGSDQPAQSDQSLC